MSRSEIRDLVDVVARRSIGCELRPALQLAMKKDAGMSANQLAWVLSNTSFEHERVPTLFEQLAGWDTRDFENAKDDLAAELLALGLEDASH